MAMKRNNKNKIPQANKIFTNREEPRKVFWDSYKTFKKNISQSYENEIKIITYYGIGGIGKTSLLKHIRTELLENVQNPLQIYIDLEENSDMLSVLMKIKHLLQSNYKFQFPVFDLAYYSYMQKQGIYVPKEEMEGFISSSPILDSLLDLTSLLPGTGTLIGLFKGIDNLNAAIRNNLNNRKRELNSIKNDDPDILIKKMPYYLACDIENNLEGQTEPFVIFIDTYESLVNELSNIGNPLDKDIWLRHEHEGLIVNIPNTIWILAGRDKLRWEQINSDWEGTLDHHLLGNLSDVDAKSFLYTAGINDEHLIKSIYALTEGVPLYLDICIDRYYSLLEKDITPSIENIGSNTQDLISRFVKYMDENKKALLYVLSCLEDWTDDLLDKLVDKFLPSIPFTVVNNIKNYSFIITEDEKYYKMHRSVRDIVYSNCDINMAGKITLYMKEYYFKELQDSKISLVEKAKILQKYVNYELKYGFENEEEFVRFIAKNILPHNENLLKNYFFNESISIFESLLNYSYINYKDGTACYYCEMQYAISHYYAGNYQISLEYGLNSYNNFNATKGEFNKNTLKALELLTITYRKMGNYPLSLSYSQKLLDFVKLENNENSRIYINALINLAVSYRKIGNFNESAKISEEVLINSVALYGEHHSLTINAMSSLANSYRQSGENNKACDLSEKVVESRTLTDGDNNPSTIAAVGSLAHSYRLIGKYELSIELSEKVVNERTNLLGDDHPLTIRAMNNLANSYRKVGRFDEGLAKAKKVYKYRFESFGEDHPNTIGALSNLATSYRKLDDLEKACDLSLKVYKWRERIFGTEHPATLRAMNNLANSYKMLDMLEESDKLYKTLINLTHKIYGQNHPSTIAAEHNYRNNNLIDIDEEDSEDLAEEINLLSIY